MTITCNSWAISSVDQKLVLSMHGFSNGGYVFIIGLITVFASMAFWFRDVIAEGRFYSHILCEFYCKRYTWDDYMVLSIFPGPPSPSTFTVRSRRRIKCRY